jgi:hypothetical protein
LLVKRLSIYRECLAREPGSESMYTTGIPRRPKLLIIPRALAVMPPVTMTPVGSGEGVCIAAGPFIGH